MERKGRNERFWKPTNDDERRDVRPLGAFTLQRSGRKFQGFGHINGRKLWLAKALKERFKIPKEVTRETSVHVQIFRSLVNAQVADAAMYSRSPICYTFPA